MKLPLRRSGTPEKSVHERAILEAAEAYGPGALDLLKSAARAEAWWEAISRVMAAAPELLDPRRDEREIIAAIRNAPPDVDVCLCAFIRRAVDGEHGISRAALRDALVPRVKGGQGRRESRTPLVVFRSTAHTPADEALLKRKGFDAPMAAMTPEKRAEVTEKLAVMFGLTGPSALRLAQARGRKAVRSLPDVPPTE